VRVITQATSHKRLSAFAFGAHCSNSLHGFSSNDKYVTSYFCTFLLRAVLVWALLFFDSPDLCAALSLRLLDEDLDDGFVADLVAALGAGLAEAATAVFLCDPDELPDSFEAASLPARLRSRECGAT